MRLTRRLMMLGVVLALALAACSSSSKPVVALDGSPRIPDVSGIVTKADATGITTNANHTYKVSKNLIAFSTYNRKPITLASTVGSFVQMGVKDNTVLWISRIGVVVTTGQTKTVSYQGDLVSVAGSILTFKDGTVLTLDKGLQAPAGVKGSTYANIDAERGVVQGATFAPPAAATTTSRPKK